MTKDGDAALVRLARAGDRDAFACLVRQHYPLVVALCRRVLGPAASAEDAAQEAVLTAMLQLDRLRRAERFGPWLAGIGLNVCRQLLRDRSRALGGWGAPIRAEPVDAAPDPADLAADGDVAARVRAAVMALPPGQRAAVLLHYLAGLSQPEVAATLGVEPGAVKTRLHKARRSLRAPLQALWMEEPMANRSKPKPAKSADPLVEMVVESVRLNVDTGQRVAVLRTKEGEERFLPIWMGDPDASSIVVALERTAVPRPTTHDLTISLLGAAGTRVREVVVERLVENVFYATVALDGPSGPAAVDARPSDAIALALRAAVPIKVHPDVLASAGVSMGKA